MCIIYQALELFHLTYLKNSLNYFAIVWNNFPGLAYK